MSVNRDVKNFNWLYNCVFVFNTKLGSDFLDPTAQYSAAC